jgi:hypothetical protein
VWDPISKNKSQKMACGVAQGVGPEFKPLYHRKEKEIQTLSNLNLNVLHLLCNNQFQCSFHISRYLSYQHSTSLWISILVPLCVVTTEYLRLKTLLAYSYRRWEVHDQGTGIRDSLLVWIQKPEGKCTENLQNMLIAIVFA